MDGKCLDFFGIEIFEVMLIMVYRITSVCSLFGIIIFDFCELSTAIIAFKAYFKTLNRV